MSEKKNQNHGDFVQPWHKLTADVMAKPSPLFQALKEMPSEARGQIWEKVQEEIRTEQKEREEERAEIEASRPSLKSLLIELEDEIEIQKNIEAKIKTARLWIKNCRQGKILIDERSLEEFEKANLIEYIEAELEHLLATEKVDRSPEEYTPGRRPLAAQWERPFQDLWNGKGAFKALLMQLSFEPAFVDKDSFNRSEKIYQSHFADSGKRCFGMDTKINWIGTWNAYRYFYDKAISKDIDAASRLFATDKSKSEFFVAHFLKDGEKILDRRKIINNRGDPGEREQEHMDQILRNIMK